jgi:flavin reductase (DIM6/NTAB) family NADH-FMN oxidoreductase RutF
VATSVGQASIAPEAPRVLVGISRRHATWELVEASEAFALHLIAADRFDLLEQFGAHTGRDTDKFAGLAVEATPSGLPLLSDSLGWLDCRVETGWDAGDRTFYLAKAVAAQPPPKDAGVMTTRAIASAPEALRRELRRQYDADAAQDLAAILHWRQGRSRT